MGLADSSWPYKHAEGDATVTTMICWLICSILSSPFIFYLFSLPSPGGGWGGKKLRCHCMLAGNTTAKDHLERN
jgi:hypothetical protein